jgi:hypothetical protein
MRCDRLSSVTFERGSKLVRINYAFCWCPSLKSLCIPAAVADIRPSALPRPSVTYLLIEEGSPFFTICGRFLTDFAGVSLNGYLGHDREVTHHMKAYSRIVSTEEGMQIEAPTRYVQLAKTRCEMTEIRHSRSKCRSTRFRHESKRSSHKFGYCLARLPHDRAPNSEYAFMWCGSLKSVSFDADSKLVRIEPQAFSMCPVVTVRVPSAVVARCEFLAYCDRISIVTGDGDRMRRA